MRKFLLIILCTSYLILFLSARRVSAGWDCVDTAVAPPPIWKCVESATATQFKTLRGCLRCEDDLSAPEKPYTDPIPPHNVTPCSIGGGGGPANSCQDDPRYVMRNFAALNFWSVGRGLSLAVPLAIAGGAALCLVFMLYGAYTYITSGGEEKKITDSMHTMTYAGLGLILIIVAYALVRTVLFVTKVNTFGF